MRLAGDADEVLHRRRGGEAHRVEATGLDHVADVLAGRGGAHRAVGDDVLHGPAEVDEAVDERVGGDVGARQQDAVDRVQVLVVGREHLDQAGGVAGLGLRQQLRGDAEVADGLGGLLTDGGDGHTCQGAGVQAELAELLPHGVDGVDGGEDDPLVAAVDQSLDGAFHLGGTARRLHGDRRHLDRDGTVGRQPGAHRAGLGLRPGNEHVPAVEGAVLPPGVLRPARRRRPEGDDQVLRQLTLLGQRAGRGDNRLQGVQGDIPGALLAGRRVDGDGRRRRSGDAVALELPGDRGEVGGGDGEDQRLRGGGDGGPVDPGQSATQVDGSVAVTGGDAVVGGQRGRTGHPGDDLELGAECGDLTQLTQHSRVIDGVAGHEAHHVDAAVDHLDHVGGEALGGEVRDRQVGTGGTGATARRVRQVDGGAGGGGVNRIPTGDREDDLGGGDVGGSGGTPTAAGFLGSLVLGLPLLFRRLELGGGDRLGVRDE